MKDEKGMLNSPNGATITLYSKDKANILVNNEKVIPVESGEGYITFTIKKVIMMFLSNKLIKLK